MALRHLRSKFFSATLGGMEGEFHYRGRVITAAEVEFIRQLIAEYPHTNRRQLSLRLCEAWGWKQANGALRDMVCRGLLLELAAGRASGAAVDDRMCIATRRRGARRTGPKPWLRSGSIPLLWKAPLRALRPLEFQQVRRTPEEQLFNYLVAEYHPLGYTRPVGEHLKYLVYAAGCPIACVAWSSAPRHLGARDRFIGWSAEARRRNIRFLAYNPRYLILPWVRVPHLASHVLGQMARRIAGDWEQIYGHPIYFLETFVDPERYRGTCYRAGELDGDGADDGPGEELPQQAAQPLDQGSAGLSTHAAFSPVVGGGIR